MSEEAKKPEEETKLPAGEKKDAEAQLWGACARACEADGSWSRGQAVLKG